MAEDGSSGGARGYVPIVGVPIADQLKIALSLLEEFHFPVNTWTTPYINSNFLTTKNFVDSVRVLTAIGNSGIKRDIIALAIKRDYFRGADEATPRQLVKFCTWLRSKEGNAVVVEIQKKKKALARKVLPGQALAQAALHAAFQEQRAEHGQTVKETRARYEAELAEMRCAIVLKQEEMENALHDIDVDFTPTSAFVEQEDTEFMEEVCRLYDEECRELGREKEPFSDELMETIRATYGDRARATFLDRFLAADNNAVDLRVWVDAHILLLEQSGQKRKASQVIDSM